MAVRVTGGERIRTVQVMTHRPVLILLALAVLSVACGSDEPAASAPDPTSAPTPAPSPTEAPGPEPSADEQVADDRTSPARERLDWFVAALNASAPPPTAEIEEQFSPAFLAQVPPEQLVQGAAQMTAGMTPPITIESVEESASDGTALEAVLVSGDGASRLRISLVTAPSEPFLIEGLLGVPDVDIEFPADLTTDRLDATLAEQSPNSAVGVYDVTDGECTALHEIRADQQVVLGSTFKLWILAELADRIAAGEASWDDTVVIEDRHKSSPDGQVFPMPTGSEMSVQELAMLMISISDNSATDHLLAHLGRENVEGVLDRIGVSSADANIPFLSTGALFQLKFVAAEPNAAEYRQLDVAARRALLAELDDAVLAWVEDPTDLDITNAEGVPTTQPRDLDLEWFATPADLCRTMTYLADQADTPGLEPVAEILEANPGMGLPFDRERWPTIRFKGGSEPGVLAGAWWFEDADGRRYVVAGGVSDPERPLDEIAASVALASAIFLVDQD